VVQESSSIEAMVSVILHKFFPPPLREHLVICFSFKQEKRRQIRYIATRLRCWSSRVLVDQNFKLHNKIEHGTGKVEG